MPSNKQPPDLVGPWERFCSAMDSIEMLSLIHISGFASAARVSERGPHPLRGIPAGAFTLTFGGRRAPQVLPCAGASACTFGAGLRASSAAMLSLIHI